MNKLAIAVVAISLLATAVVSSSSLIEARSFSDTRSASVEHGRSGAEVQMPRSEKDRKQVVRNKRQLYQRVSPVTMPVLPSAAPLVLEIELAENASPADLPARVPEKPREKSAVVSTAEFYQVETPTHESVEEAKIVRQERSDVAPVGQSSNDFMARLATEIHRLTNLERAQAGLAMLGYDPSLAVIATQHSMDMADQDYFSHTAPDGCDLGCRLDRAGYEVAAWGENIAWRSSSQQSAAVELAAYFVGEWMASPDHRRNILSANVTQEGVGIAQVGNKVYVTANFSDPR